MGDLTGDSMAGLTGELMGDLVSEPRGEEAGILTGDAAARVGEGTADGSWTGADEGHGGLSAAGEGDGVVLSGFSSSGMNGSGKNRVPGDFTRITCDSGSGEGLSGERTMSSFCTGLTLDSSILEAILRLSDFLSSSGSTSGRSV